MKNLCVLSFLLFVSSMLAQSPFIHVDQFGYTPQAKKVAVLSNPELGQNSSLSYTPSSVLELWDTTNDELIASYTPTQWQNGDLDATRSGDRGWWIDFSEITTPGTYVLVDVQNSERSAEFTISKAAYSEVLQAASKMFYYNRCNYSKEAPFAEASWIDAQSNFDNALQDKDASYIYDIDNISLRKDLSGGWFDAGDYNKYVSFTLSTLHNLLWAYEDNPKVFGDNNNIPESNNGLSDLLDEIKWELDWLVKMTNDDGSVHNKLGSNNYGENADYPPSNNFGRRYYGPTCTSASLTVASVFAHAARVFGSIEGYDAYSMKLRDIAVRAWNYVLPFYESGNLEYDCDDGSIVSGDADFNFDLYQETMISAAIYLFALTGDQSYNQFVKTNYLSSLVFGATPNDGTVESLYDDWWDINQISSKDAYLFYGTLPGHDTKVADDFRTSFKATIQNNWEGFLGMSDNDLYRAYLPSYFLGWGSNQSQGNMGILNYLVYKYALLDDTDIYLEKAMGHLNYLHGTNPLGLCYLSNMYAYGAEKCVDEIYHAWFANNSPYDNVNSSRGPAPGYLAGGPNHFYGGGRTPPSGEPYLKAYDQFNDIESASWEITEPAIYYQAAYLRLAAIVEGLDDSEDEPDPPIDEESYEAFAGDRDWKTLKTGAGGWLTGMNIHPQGNPVYARSDVGGAYRYNPLTQEWKQIVVAEAFSEGEASWESYQGVLSLVSAPSNANRAYMAYKEGIYFSNDQGERWYKSNFPQMEMYANDDESKTDGERLAVDPADEDLVYFCSIEQGLWRSLDGGKNWVKVQDVPNGSDFRGVRTILFDPSSISAGKAQVIYVTVDGIGIFRSEDAGESFYELNSNNLYSKPNFYDAKIGSDGSLYVTGEDVDQGYASIGVLRYRGDNWEKLYDGDFTIGEIALDPFKDRAILFSRGFSEIFTTNNLTAPLPNWTNSTNTKVATDIPQLAWTPNNWFVIGAVVFDPVVEDRIWIADGLGTWQSDDLGDNLMTWKEISKGQEHLVSNDIAVLPGGKAVTLHWDRPIFYHQDLDAYPLIQQPSDRFNSAWSIAQSPEDPDYMVAVIEDHRFCCIDENSRSSGYSEDGGRTWTKFQSMPEPGNGNLIFGEIALSANDKDNIIWLPSDNRPPYITFDRGNSWVPVDLPNDSGNCCLSGFFLKRRALTADQVLPNTFYIYDWGDGSIFSTADGGMNWTKSEDVISSYAWNAKLLSVPGKAQHLLFANGPEEDVDAIEGLSMSEDGGKTWVEFQNTEEVLNCAVGKQAPTGSYPTIYIQGKVNGTFGIFRSEDKGTSWIKIGQHPLGIYDWANVMKADPNNHERLYLGYKGNGFVYYGALETPDLIDNDGDGFTEDEDCDDSNADIFPGAIELCNGIDDDCDGEIDNGVETERYYIDLDGDGFGDLSVSIEDCTQPQGYVINDKDCDDSNADIFPGAIELCNGIDDDCDGEIDNGVETVRYYIDLDGDGFGDLSVSIEDCTQPQGYVINGEDCDDSNADIFPGAIELCNGIDDDCNGEIDNGVETERYYIDLDEDGFGDLTVSIEDCMQPQGYVMNGEDCDDSNADINPNAEDIPNNGIDENCDGVDLISSVLEPDIRKIQIFPNPVTDQLFLHNFELVSRLEFYNAAGKMVREFNYSGQAINVAQLEGGLYFIKVYNRGGKYLKGLKLIKL